MGSLAFREEAGLPNTPLTEDAFYSLSVARNIALGNGITIDGEMLTNGFQPLYTFLIATPIYYFNQGDRIESLRWLYVANTFIILLTTLLISSIAYGTQKENKKLRRAFLCGLLYLSAAGLWRFHYNGLETGFLLFMYTLSWFYYQRVGVHSLVRAFCFGILLGFLVFTRIDAGFFVLVVVLAELLNRESVFLKRLQRVLFIGIPVLVVVSPWFSYNYFYFGSLTPSSGIAQEKSGVTVKKILAMFEALCEVLTPTFFLGQWEGGWSIVIRLCILGFFCFLALPIVRKGKLFVDDYNNRTFRYASYLLLTYILLVMWYLFQSVATWFYPRYLAPVALLAILLITLIVENSSKRVRTACYIAVLLVSLQIPLFVYWHHTNQVFRGSIYYNQELSLVKEYVPEGVLLGADESGTVGYFRDGVVNLDGKVNFEVIKRRHHLLSYLQEKGIHWWITRRKLPQEYFDHGWQQVVKSNDNPPWYLYYQPQSN